jgi:acyl carrier protein
MGGGSNGGNDSMINFIDLFNMVSEVSRPAHAGKAPASSMEDKLGDIGIDSLDGLIMVMYFCELYGVPDDDETKEWHPISVQEVYDYLERRKTQQPESVDIAREAIK